MTILKLILSSPVRVAILLIYSLVFLILISVFKDYSTIVFLVYVVSILIMVYGYRLNFAVSKDVMINFVELVFTKMYDFPNRRDFLNVIKNVFKVVDIKANDILLFIDNGKGTYGLVEGEKSSYIREIAKEDIMITKFISSTKAMIPFVDLKNTTLIPREVFDNSKEIITQVSSNYMIPIYSPNYDVLGLVFFNSDKVSFKKLFYLSQFINILGMMFKTVEDAERRKVLEEDIRIASQIQSKLIPTDYISNSWFESYGVYIPAYNIGGDYLDIISMGKRFTFAIGDVSGKGISAGIVAMMVKAILNSTDINNKNITRVMKNLNSYIYRWFYSEENILTFMTLLILNYVPERRIIHYTNTGHVPGILVRKSNKVELLSADAKPLGLFSNINIKKKSVEVNQGDLLLLYTDGLIEQMDVKGSEFGIPRLKEILLETKHLEPREIVDNILKHLREFSKQELDDDICILVIKFR
ncbi:MAG: serine/threonine-protein phosphatase [Spirochaetes bacterium]|nr:serine/threonine-protein phosphatase [Spirochaetota bacterium]